MQQMQLFAIRDGGSNQRLGLEMRLESLFSGLGTCL